MGSLMAGWDSHVPDRRLVRNKSLTNGEIENFWKLKKQKEEEHLRAISHRLSPPIQENEASESVRRYERSSSLPLPNTRGETMMSKTESSLEKLIQKNGWWVSSNWAFLNEPPVIAQEGPAYRYAAQFHVADMAA